MSHHALQHALVIAFHDEEFVRAVHADPQGTLAPLGLSATEIAQLRAVDQRAFRTDPLRRRRVLRVLAEELKVSTTLVLAETRRLAFVEAFFASPFFRRAVMERLPLAPAFGDYLANAQLKTPLLGDIVAIETTVARARRDKERVPHRGVALAPGVAVGRFAEGTLAAMQAVERYLFELALMPQAALCEDAPPVPPPAPSEGTIGLLFTPSQAGVSIAPVDEDLYRVLDAFRAPVARREAVRVLEQRGVPARGAEALLDSLLVEGLLAEGLQPGATLLT